MRLVCFSLTFLAGLASAFPEYRSMAGMSREEVDLAAATFSKTPGAQPAPGPPSNTASRLIHDKKHRYRAPRIGDMRGPCPGLNTLANHGYIDRTGVATPGEIINAVQDAFNMKNNIAVFVTYGAMLVDGNHLTNLLSIGKKTRLTGPGEPGPPAIIGGLNTHGVFEGDASLTRGDDHFGDNVNFNETLFQQVVAASDTAGNGTYNSASAALHRFNRLRDSIARNPVFDFTSPRFFTAYVEAIFPYRLMVDGRASSPSLSLTDMRLFFEKGTFPKDWHRREGGWGFEEAALDLFDIYLPQYRIPPGRNNGAGNFTIDTVDRGFQGGGICYIYNKHVGITVPSLYPNPQGALRTAIKKNIKTFWAASQVTGEPFCEEIFPYGQ